MSAIKTLTSIVDSTCTDADHKPLRVHPDANVEAVQVCSDEKDSSGFPELEDGVLIVDWDGPDDPENPQKCVLSMAVRSPVANETVVDAAGPHAVNGSQQWSYRYSRS